MKITEADILLVKHLERYTYDKTMNGIVPEEEQNQLRDLKDRLEQLSLSFKQIHDAEAGPFQSERSTGNPVSQHGKLRRIWAGIFKGNDNKQYSAQISFVVNPKEHCLDVGFYFGRASSFKAKKEVKKIWEGQLKELGKILHQQISTNSELRESYENLFELGFKADIKDRRVTSDEWLANLLIDPTYSSIVFNLKPNERGEIELSDISFYFVMVLPLITVLPEAIDREKHERSKRVSKPLTPEQRARQAEKRTLIGLHGEEYVMKIERERVKALGMHSQLPIHKSIESDSFRYDILSTETGENEIFIEVKTTSLMKSEKASKTFYISANEFSFYKENMKKYRLYRVYDIYGKPSHEVIELSEIEPQIESFRVDIPHS